MKSRRLIIGVLVLLALTLPASAGAAPRVDASFLPNRPGASTAIRLGFSLGWTPSRLVGVALHLPREISSSLNTLGLATCDASELEARGPRVCPRDSLIGRGLGAVSVPFGLERIREPLAVDIFMAPAMEEQTRVLFYVEGSNPVITQLAFEGSMQGDKPPFGTLIEAAVPEIAGLPGSPAPALVSLQTELGPKDLRYTKVENGKTVSFAPKGFNVPPSCPAGGFPFAADFSFADGSHRSASTRAACPRQRDKNGRRRKDVG